MRSLARLVIASLIALAFASAAQAASAVKLVAAENFYGDIAGAIGGASVEVVSILNNPDQDPHLFETSSERGAADRRRADRRSTTAPTTTRGWSKLLAAAPRPDRDVIDVADLMGKKAGRQSASLVRPGDHAGGWPRRSPRRSAKVDPDHAARLRRAAEDDARLARADRRQDRRSCAPNAAGAPVTATEPVFGYMADGARPQDAQRALPARGHERHRAERAATSPPSRTI